MRWPEREAQQVGRNALPLDASRCLSAPSTLSRRAKVFLAQKFSGEKTADREP